MPSKYSIGIDLGTTNSVLAYCSLESDQARVEVLQVPQLVASGTVESRTMLPSFMYLGLENEARSGAFDMPWAAGRDFAVGEYARRQGRRSAGSHRGHGQVLAVLQPRGSPAADSALERPGRGAQGFAGHGLAALLGAFGGRLGSGLSRRSAGPAKRGAYCAGLVRRQRPGANARGRLGRRTARGSGALGRTAGGGLRLAGRQRRSLAEAAYGGRYAFGLRRGRRDHRFHAWSASARNKTNWSCGGSPWAIIC